MVVRHTPVLTSPFVGRQCELVEIAQILTQPASRLITLVGAGGVGKTRLALETAAAQLEHFPDGAHFVPLQALCPADSVMLAVGEALRFQFFAGGDPIDQLSEYLHTKTLLLILDNAEHLLDELAVLSDLLARAPHIKVLVTSRERLNLVEEWVYEVGGLTFPPGDDGVSGADYGAVQLFVQNARRVQPAFSVTDEQAAINRICALVQGMPLALELASAWTRVLSCAEIATEIERGLDILQTSARNVPERHRSMRAVLDQSWERLTAGEQAVLRKLALFRGGFTRESAAMIADASLHALSALVDKSWLYRSASTGRYDLHELVRQFAAERLADSGETEMLSRTYATFYAELVARCEAGIKRGGQSAALAELERDFENIRAAWAWAVAQRAISVLHPMLEAINFFCDMRARFHEGEALFRAAADQFAALDLVLFYRARARRTRMIMLGLLDDSYLSAPVVQEMEEAVRFFRDHNDPRELSFSLYMLGMVQSEHCASPKATAAFRESYDIASELNDQFYSAELLTWLAVIEESLSSALPLHQQAVAIQREIGDVNGLAWNLLHLSRIAFWERRSSAAEAYAAEAEAIQRERGDLKGLAWSMLIGSERAFQQGRFAEAQNRAVEAERIADRLALPSNTQATLAWSGLLQIVTEADYAEGERRCRQALAIHAPQDWGIGDARLHATIGLILAAHHAGDQAAARDHYKTLVELLDALGVYVTMERFPALAVLGSLLLAGAGHDERAAEVLAALHRLPRVQDDWVLSWLGQIRLLERTQTEIAARLGEEQFAAAWERGLHLSPDALLPDLCALPTTLQSEPLDSALAESAPPPNPDALTDREREVLGLLADGLSNREIAARLVLALGTVKWYISVIYSKLGVTRRTQAIARARELKLVA
jgi:predicted ATPase/DNA-binding CsgD family transcriptional regulator